MVVCRSYDSELGMWKRNLEGKSNTHFFRSRLKSHGFFEATMEGKNYSAGERELSKMAAGMQWLSLNTWEDKCSNIQ